MLGGSCGFISGQKSSVGDRKPLLVGLYSLNSHFSICSHFRVTPSILLAEVCAGFWLYSA